MKMSKSIKDYKEAMDNVKISESFYQRTETLLTEIPAAETGKISVSGGRRHITAIVMSAAACAVCVLGVRLALGSSTDTITETTTADSGVSVTETERKADELIDRFDEYDDGGIVADDIDEVLPQNSDTEEPAETVVPIAANPCSDDPQTVTTSATETRTVQGIDPYTGAAETTATEAVPNPVPNPGVNDGDIEEDIIDDEETAAGSPSDDVPDTDSGAVPSEKSLLFSELNLEHTTVDVTPYFDMDGIKSGETAVQKSGTEFKPILDLISGGMDEYATKIGNSTFTSLFSIRIYNDNIDLDFYNVYLSNYESIVITKHSPDGSQVRETYALRREYYQDLRHWLFLLFSTEEDYELFLNLIGGK